MKCIICSNTAFRTIVKSSVLTVSACKKCDFYIVPQDTKKPETVNQYFKNYDLKRYISYYEKFRKKIYRSNWKQITQWKKRGISLDCGASFGWFLEVAPRNWKAYGIEPSAVAVKESKKKGLTVITGTDENVSCS